MNLLRTILTEDQLGALCVSLPFLTICIVFGLGLLARLDQPARVAVASVERGE